VAGDDRAGLLASTALSHSLDDESMKQMNRSTVPVVTGCGSVQPKYQRYGLNDDRDR